MGAILKIGNRLNRAGIESMKPSADGFTVESLAKLNQVKTSKKTSLLFYIATIIQNWNASLLCVKDDMSHVLKAQHITTHATALKSLEQELDQVQQIIQSINFREDGTRDSGAISTFVQQSSETISHLREASNKFDDMFRNVRLYLAMEEDTNPKALFGMISSFCNDLDLIHSQLKKKEKRKKYRSITRRSYDALKE